jgi:hypothetical protein
MTEFGWVIEKHDSEPCEPLYWSCGVNPLSWSKDNLEAVRFARKEDAARFMDECFDHANMKNRIAEHGWG